MALSPLRVLVVDDNEDAATTLAFLLKHFGHETSVVTGGEAALQQAPLFRPHAMLIDLAMPEFNGIRLARHLRQAPEFAATPLVAVTGHVDPEHRAQALASGFTDFLPKPYTLVQLQSLLDEISGRIAASLRMAQRARQVAEQTRALNEAARQSLDEYYRQRGSRSAIPVTIQKSGISRIVILPERPAADELRRWLKARSCRVGPVFEPHEGQFAFFVYSRRLEVGELISGYGGFKVRS